MRLLSTITRGVPRSVRALAVVVVSAVAMPAALHAQSAAAVPFTVGEEMVYKASFGVFPAGTARMRVDGIETVRNRQAYHLVFTIDGGIPGFRIHDRYESWIDIETLSSLRHRQEIS